MTEPVTTWRYRLDKSTEPRDSWSIVFVDSTGCFTVLSDYGNYGMRWWTPHTGFKDFREFLLTCDSDYMARKIGRSEDNDVFDDEETRNAIQRRICELRRELRLSKYDARREWESADGIGSLLDFHGWYLNTKLDDAHELGRHCRNGQLKHWTEVSFERLKQVIRAELATEKEGR